MTTQTATNDGLLESEGAWVIVHIQNGIYGMRQRLCSLSGGPRRPS